MRLGGVMFALFGYGSRLQPHEELVLQTIAGQLEPELRKVYLRQIDSINKVQRFSKGKEVNLYVTRFGKPNFDMSLSLPQVTDEEVFATVNITIKGRRTPLRCDVWLVSGRIFSLVFNAPPRELVGSTSLVELSQASAAVHYRGSAVGLENCYEKCTRSEVFPMLAKVMGVELAGAVTSREGIPKETIECDPVANSLPVDYQQLLTFHNGIKWEYGWIHGLDEKSVVVTENWNFRVLAEVGTERLLGIREGQLDGQVFELAHDTPPRPVGTSLVLAIFGECRPPTQ